MCRVRTYPELIAEKDAEIEKLRALVARVVADHDELSPHLIGMPLNVANSTIEDCRAAVEAK
jgi:hypothetical protein